MTTSPTKTLSKQRSFSSSTPSSRFSIYFLMTSITRLSFLFLMTSITLLSFLFLMTSITLLSFLQIRALNSPLHFSLPSSSWRLHRRRQKAAAATFLPLKDLRFSDTPMEGNTWFMSSLNDTRESGETEHLHFPSDASGHRLLCLDGISPSNGMMNSYALVSPGELPPSARLLSGLTFVADTYYDYENLYHGISAVVPFVAWHGRKECVRPARWVLYHWGEMRTRMSPWVRTLVEAVFGEEMGIEGFEGRGEGPWCFERAVVFRKQEGSMARRRKEEVYDMMRCKARDYCKVGREVGVEREIRLTLLLREGGRSFKNEAAVIKIFEKECGKVEGCRIKVAWPKNLTFCDQVKLMSTTDILVSPHGAQMTNMIFMDKNGSVMEFFPKGWKEHAGEGQYVFRWIANWSALRHQGAWNDPNGEPCPHHDDSGCFAFYKDGRIGHDEAFFANWTAAVLGEMREHKLGETSRSSTQAQLRSSPCPCG